MTNYIPKHPETAIQCVAGASLFLVLLLIALMAFAIRLQHQKKTAPAYVFFGFMFFFVGTVAGQDCYQPPTLITGSGSVSFGKQLMTATTKVGVWRNVHSNGWTANVGYRSNTRMSFKNHKGDSVVNSSTMLVEAGYKARINDKVFTHGFAGYDISGAYLGAELLYQASWNLLIGASYVKSQVGITTYIRFN